MNDVITLLVSAGFVQDGQTVQQTVRVPTVANPVYGGIGGELATMGGRQRFHLPGTNLKVTVGKQTTFFYRLLDTKVAGRRETQAIAHLKTKALETVKETLQNLLQTANSPETTS